jgi:hypothetical protein
VGFTRPGFRDDRSGNGGAGFMAFRQGLRNYVEDAEPRHSGCQHVRFKGVTNKLRGLTTCSVEVSGLRVDWGGGLRIEGRGLRFAWLRRVS